MDRGEAVEKERGRRKTTGLQKRKGTSFSDREMEVQDREDQELAELLKGRGMQIYPEEEKQEEIATGKGN